MPDIPTHRVAYLFLRQAIAHFLSTGGHLSLSEKPLDAFNWQPPQAGALNLAVDHHVEDMVPTYIALPDLLEAGGAD